jgi:3-hydroxybutyrate dehydrogenase
MSHIPHPAGPAAAGVDLSGRRALVTGAGSGIDRACAQRLAAAGAEVIVLDLDSEAAKRVADETGGHAIQANLGDPGVVDTLKLDADIVVNNAGLQHVAPSRSSLRSASRCCCG